MKRIALFFTLLPFLLTGCEGFGPTKVGICHEGTCINFEIPARVSGKEVLPVQ
jgi:hypothetical protein